MLMDEYPELNFVYNSNMENKHKGLLISNTVILNPNQLRTELYGTISEEIAHYEYTVGDISEQLCNDSRKQEKKARVKGHFRIVTPEVLIEAYYMGMKHYWEVAEWLSVSAQFVFEAVQYYIEIYGVSFKYNDFLFLFSQSNIKEIKK